MSDKCQTNDGRLSAEDRLVEDRLVEDRLVSFKEIQSFTKTMVLEHYPLKLGKISFIGLMISGRLAVQKKMQLN